MCSICLDEYEDGAVLKVLPCGHSYHEGCILPWLCERSTDCPLCKRPVFDWAGRLIPAGVYAGSLPIEA